MVKLIKSLLASLIMASLWVAPNLSYAQDQTIENIGSYLGVNKLEKPAQEDSKQKIKNERSFLNINIIRIVQKCENKVED